MEKGLFRIFCVLNSLAVIYGTPEKGHGETGYDLIGLVAENVNRYENSLRAKQTGALHRFKVGGIDENPKFEPSGNWLQNFSKCSADILYTLKNIKSHWAMELFDSFGKPESGILQGNIRWLGNYDECLNVSSTNPNSTVGNFRGKYCTVSLSVNYGKTILPFAMPAAICIPDSCSAEELEEDALQLLHIAGALPSLSNNSIFQNITLQCKLTKRHLNGAAISVIAVLSVFFALTLAGSSITAFKYFKNIFREDRSPSFFENVDSSHLIGDQKDIATKQDDVYSPLQDELPESLAKAMLLKFEGFLNCFCIFTNGSKILNTNTSEGELLSVHGIRFFSMCWVILGHAYMTGITQMKNILSLKEYVDTFLFQIVLQGFYSVDSFFVLSGFLLAYLVMNEFAKSDGRIAWPYFYIHRYIRLTPIYMILLGFSATVYLYLGSGPYWPDGDIDKNCQENWWKNLIYINNFYDQSEQCMGWSWYLANDMQFFIISPLFLITLWRWPKVGYLLIAVFMLACWLSNFIITYHFELMAGVFNVSQAATASLTKFTDYFNRIYIKPYTRISPYLVGMVTGYLVYKRKAENYPKHSLVFVCLGWTFSCAVGLICVFVLYHQNPSLIGNCFYNALNRTGYAVSLAWVIYACLVGEGGFVNRILSSKFLIPLSRLTYAAYLVHPMLMMGYFSSVKSSIEFSHPTVVYLFLGFLVASYALALPVALMLESPVIALEKWIRKSFARQKKNEINN